MTIDTRQTKYTELTATCGHQVVVRLDVNPVIAADMIATFMARDCGRSTCSAPRQSTRNITWADVNRGR
jgi:hypothetical protein